jgi:hypothetical protein
LSISTITRAHKNPVRVATTTNITLSGLQTVDGVVLAAGDRVLVKNQTDGRFNGIYLVSSSVWSRAPDADHSDEVLPGMECFVIEGTANGGEKWFLDIEETVNLNNTVLSFSEAATGGGGGASDHSELTGLTADDHPQYRRHYVAVADIAARDALTNLVEGMLVHVDSTRRIYVRDGGTWQTYKILPNYDIKTTMENAVSLMAFLYVASTGNDETGTGSQAAPFATFQRCIQAIPPGCNGYLQVQCLDAGPFVGDVIVPDLAGTVSINFVGAGASVLDLTGMSAGVADANAAGGNKYGRLRHVAGAHGTITNSSHWVKGGLVFGGDTYYLGAVIDGDNSPSPDISIINYFGIDITTYGYTTLDLVPYTTVLIPTPGNAYISMRTDCTPLVTLNMVGMKIEASTVSIEGAVSLIACHLDATFTSHPVENTDQNHLIVNEGVTWITGVGMSTVYLTGLFLDTIYMGAVFCYLHGIFRTTSQPKIQVGIGSLSHPRRATSCVLAGDFELGSIVDVYVIGSSLRIYDDGSRITCDGTSGTFVAMWNHSDMLGSVVLGSVYGSTTGIPFSFYGNSHTEGLISPGYGTAPLIRNTTNPGQDVGIGQGTSTLVVSFADLPVTELNSSSRAG